MGRISSIKSDVDFIMFLAYAEAAIWAYFFIQVGLSLARFSEWKAWFKEPAASPAPVPPAVIYLKRAGIALVVAGIIKLAATFYTAFAIKSNFPGL